jgi:hypothetical protein
LRGYLTRFIKRSDTVGMPVTGAYYGNLDNSEGDIKLVGSVEQAFVVGHAPELPDHPLAPCS